MKAFEKKFGAATPLADGKGFHFKKDKWIFEDPKSSKSICGSVSVNIWPHNQNVLLQGSHYIAFLTFVLPSMIVTVGKKAISHAADKNDVVTEKDDAAELDLSVTENDVLVDSFKTLELEVYNLRNESLKPYLRKICLKRLPATLQNLRMLLKSRTQLWLLC